MIRGLWLSVGLLVGTPAWAARVQVEVIEDGAIIYKAKFSLTGVDTLFGAQEGERGYGGVVTQHLSGATVHYEVTLLDRRHRRSRFVARPTLVARPDQEAQFWTQDAGDRVAITITPD